MRNRTSSGALAVLIVGALVQISGAQNQPLDAQSALQLAAQNRPAVKAARLKVEQARLMARALGASPAIRLGVGYSTKSDIGATDQDAFLSQPIELFGRTQVGRASGTALIQQAEAAYRAELLDLQTDVLGALSDAVTSVKLSTTADSILKNAERLKWAVDRKFDEGKVAEVQQTRAGIEVMRARQNSELRAAQKRSALKRLSAELASAVGEEQLISFPALAELSSSDISQRPNLLLLAADLNAAKAEISAARVSNRPEFEIQALRSPWHGQDAQFGARFQLTWPIFDSGKSRNESKAAEKRAQASEQALIDARLKGEADLAATLEELSGAKAQVESYRAILESARILVKKTQIGYDEGASTLVDVLEATRSLREVEEGSVEAEQRLANAMIAVYRAAGILAGGLK